jgi:predicted TIM-barrel fold metal-dependent hydrolase
VAYTYKVVPFAVVPPQRSTRMENLATAAAEMERLVNQWAASGWEFMGVQQVQLADFATHYDVLVFRADA